ncbi:hypothetical protein [Mycolicibacterium sp. 050158]|uniref:hypothetical protein n=1 Tax=Mycolicibacterium sp. 050158 TaxID=3090602 RepID=UPI00299DFE2F|nr:hypothetical protein [Mycolicibacterium sp. 050158]MDX1891197.1 hypothetical protein [Mycolicibacterium sp. 050158]
MNVVSHRTPARTRAFARVLGPFLAVATLTVALRAPDMRGLLEAFTGSQVWPWVTGAYLLLGGIAIIAFHQYWGGVAEAIISLLGWLVAARGILLLAFPHVFAAMADRVIGVGAVWAAVYVIMGVIGLYLTYVGWRPETVRARDDAARPGQDLPRAA